MLKIPIRNPYTIVTLGAAIAILATGIVFRPKERNVRQLSESDVARLQQSAQRNRLTELSRFLREAADDASGRLLYLKSQPHTAVLWERNQAVTAREWTHAAKEANLRVLPTRSEAPLQAFTTPSEPSRAVPRGKVSVTAGDWVLSVARSDADQVIFSYGIYQNKAPAHCGAYDYQQINSTAVLSDALLGGGVFKLNGELIGLITSCEGNPMVMSAESVTAVLRQPISDNERLQQLAGFDVTSRLFVTMIRTGGPADIAGMKAGDTLLELDGKEVRGAAELGALASVEAQVVHEIVILRNRKKLLLRFGEPDIGAAGITLSVDAAGNVVASQVAQDTPYALAGLRPGDSITRIDGAAVLSPQQAARMLSTTRGKWPIVSVERGAAKLDLAAPHE